MMPVDASEKEPPTEMFKAPPPEPPGAIDPQFWLVAPPLPMVVGAMALPYSQVPQVPGV